MSAEAPVGQHVAILAIDRDSAPTIDERLAAFDGDPALRALILSGEFSGYPGAGGVVRRPTKPVIAAIRGACLDAGLVIVARAAGIRVAGRSARFGFGDEALGD